MLGDRRGAGRTFRINPGAVEDAGARARRALQPRASTRTRKIWQLSVGEQQRVEILKALYQEARILILDEPTAVLTPDEADTLFATLRQMAAEGRTVIFISHKLHEVKAVSDRVTVLRAGEGARHGADRRRDAAVARRADGRSRHRDRQPASGHARRRQPAGARARRRLGRAATAATPAVKGVSFDRPRRRDRRGRRCLRQRPARARGGDRGPSAVHEGLGRGRRARCSATATRARRSTRGSATCPRTGSAPAWRRALARDEPRAQVVPRRLARPVPAARADARDRGRGDPHATRSRRRARTQEADTSRAGTCRRS